jgi:hypothetical protein
MTDSYQCTCCPGEGHVVVKIPSGYWRELQRSAEAWASLNLKIEGALSQGKEKLAEALEDDEFEYRGENGQTTALEQLADTWEREDHVEPGSYFADQLRKALTERTV